MLTGDDLVVEYVTRLVEALKEREEKAPLQVESRINQFIYYKVWSTPTLPAHATRIDEKLKLRVDDMRDRKFKLFHSKLNKSQG